MLFMFSLLTLLAQLPRPPEVPLPDNLGDFTLATQDQQVYAHLLSIAFLPITMFWDMFLI